MGTFWYFEVSKPRIQIALWCVLYVGGLEMGSALIERGMRFITVCESKCGCSAIKVSNLGSLVGGLGSRPAPQGKEEIGSQVVHDRILSRIYR